MQYKVDLVKEVVLLIAPDHQVVDAFLAEGRTSRTCPHPVAFYTYRSLLTLPGHCLLCAKTSDDIDQPCVSSGGFHAFVGLEDAEVPHPGHLAKNRSAAFVKIHFEDLDFFLERDHLFPAEDIAEAMPV